MLFCCFVVLLFCCLLESVGTVFQTAAYFMFVIPRLRPGLLSLCSVLSSRQTDWLDKKKEISIDKNKTSIDKNMKKYSYPLMFYFYPLMFYSIYWCFIPSIVVLFLSIDVFSTVQFDYFSSASIALIFWRTRSRSSRRRSILRFISSMRELPFLLVAERKVRLFS